MSKYIIEIEEKPLCVFDKDTQTYFPRLWRVKGFNSLVFDKEGLSRLEELNSDYINEHFGELQEDAFNKGMLFKEEKIHDAYKRGFEDGKVVNDKGCEGCEYEGKTGEHLPCDYCKNAYTNQWRAKKEEIGAGDVVIYNQKKWIVVAPETNERYASLFDSNGNHCSASSQNCQKTGEHYNINEILGGLRHD